MSLVLTSVGFAIQTAAALDDKQLGDNFNLDLGVAKEVDTNRITEILSSDTGSYLTLRDWSHDGKLVLVSQGLVFGLMDVGSGRAERLQLSVEGIDVIQNVTKGTLVNRIEIIQARFSATDSNLVYVIIHYVHLTPNGTNNPEIREHEDLFAYNLTDGSTTGLYGIERPGRGWLWFDVMSDPSKLFLRDDFRLYILDVDSHSKQDLRTYSGELPYDLSADGSKLLTAGTGTSFDVVDFRENITKSYSIRPLRSLLNDPFIRQAFWAPDDNYIVYSYGVIPSEPRAPWWADTIQVQSIHGSTDFELKKVGGPANIIIGNMLLSHDGGSLIVKGDCCGPRDIYQFDLARPVPEFGPFIILPLCVAIAASIAILKRLRVRIKEYSRSF
jgi:hypothetical protein